jgi:2,4-dichlorophenol 6-monooxygenase
MPWCTSLGGEGEWDRKRLYDLEAWGGGSVAAIYQKDSPCKSTNYPQVRLEPLPKARAQSSTLATLKFRYELATLEQADQGVLATVRDRTGQNTFQARGQYLVAADAGKAVGPIVGAKLEDTPELLEMVTVYFGADLSAYINDDGVSPF